MQSAISSRQHVRWRTYSALAFESMRTSKTASSAIKPSLSMALTPKVSKQRLFRRIPVQPHPLLQAVDERGTAFVVRHAGHLETAAIEAVGPLGVYVRGMRRSVHMPCVRAAASASRGQPQRLPSASPAPSAGERLRGAEEHSGLRQRAWRASTTDWGAPVRPERSGGSFAPCLKPRVPQGSRSGSSLTDPRAEARRRVGLAMRKPDILHTTKATAQCSVRRASRLRAALRRAQARRRYSIAASTVATWAALHSAALAEGLSG